MRGIDRVRGAAALLLASTLLIGPLLVAGDTGLVGAVVGLAVLAWAVRADLDAVRAVVSVATSPTRTIRRAVHADGTPRQCDPDAAGRPRPRAPGRLRPEQATG